jgi:hypothetical protein
VADVEGDGKAVVKKKPEFDSSGTPATEHAYYELSKVLGFDMVPPTIIDDEGNERQSFVPDCMSSVPSGEKVSDKALDTFSKIAAMDIATGNNDRGSWNWLYDTKNKDFVANDNGYAFLCPTRTPRDNNPATGKPVRNYTEESCSANAEEKMADSWGSVLGKPGKYVIKKEHVEAIRRFVTSGKHKEFLAQHFTGKQLQSAIKQMEVGVARFDHLTNGVIV